LSYSKKDRSVAFAIGDKLREAKARVFMAPQSEIAGTVFTEEFKLPLLGSQEMWIIVSPSSLNTEWVTALLGAAWVLGKKLVPILRCCDAPQCLPRFRNLRCIDVTRVGELIKEHLNPIKDR